jgi:hypothetical protein
LGRPEEEDGRCEWTMDDRWDGHDGRERGGGGGGGGRWAGEGCDGKFDEA